MRLDSFLDHFLQSGGLEVRWPDGRLCKYGSAAPGVTVALRDRATVARIMANPEMAVGEAYMDGRLVVERGSIYDMIDLAGANAAWRPDRKRPGALARWWLDVRLQTNSRLAARRNVAHHYDLSAEFYRRFLDEDMQYSCAYFTEGGMSLEQAQLAKKRHIAAKLAIEPGQKVLDIGCGWGGMALTLAEECEAQVEGVTLSAEQFKTAQTRARARGLAKQARFSLTDYRDIVGLYDRIVSVGMFEHVGRPNFQAYFDQVARLLSDDGLAVIHFIGRSEGPNITQPWLAKYIFPGGYIPALSEVLPAVERAGLIVDDIEVLRLHYAETLRHWRERFLSVWDEVAAMYDERFCRMWEFYLAASETAFRRHNHVVFQLQLSKRIDAAPLTRDYIFEHERRIDAIKPTPRPAEMSFEGTSHG